MSDTIISFSSIEAAINESNEKARARMMDLFDGLSAEDIQYITGIPEQRCVEILLIVQDAINDFKRKLIS